MVDLKDDNLEIGKELAILFLYMDMEETKFSPMIVMHPIFESAIIMNGKQELFNALEDTTKYQEYLKIMEKEIRTCETLSEIVRIIRKSYRLTFIYFLLKEGVNKVICGNLLAEQWTLIETLTYDKNVKPRQVLSLIKSADKTVLMDKQELEIFSKLDDEIIIYRGARTKNGFKGCSWSLEQEQGEWFANRHGTKGFVFKAKIKKNDVIAFKNERSEKEIIADYTKIYDVEVIGN